MAPDHKLNSAPTPRRSAVNRWWVWAVVGATAVALTGVGWLLLGNPDSSAERGAALAAGQDLRPDAGERLSAYLARHPDDAQVCETLVVWSLRTGVPYSQLEPHLDRLCELSPTNPTAWRTRAVERVRAGRLAEGVGDARRALELDPADADALTLLATTALDAGDPAPAVRALRQRVESSGTPPDTFIALLVRAYLQEKDVRAAEAVVDRYFPSTRTDAQSRVLRGLVHQAAGRHTEAIQDLRSASQTVDQRKVALAALAQSLTALGREAEATQVLDQLDATQARERAIFDAQQRPDDLAAQARAAEVHLTDGNPLEAVRLLEKTTTSLGRTPETIALLARAYRQIGREDLARRVEQQGGR